MKSGKSLELIARVAPYEFAKKQVLYIQPARNVRDSGVSSRLGLNIKARKVNSLKQVSEKFDVIGIDEVHMFSAQDVQLIKKWLQNGKIIVISGLDIDYKGRMMAVIKKILELKPDYLITKVSVCETCHEYAATYTQVLHKGEAVTQGLPAVVPDDGTYSYEARCRDCFITV